MKKLVIAGVAGSVVAAALMYLVVLPMLFGKPSPHPDVAGAAATPATPAPQTGMLYPLPERVLNLASSGGAPHYARIELAFEFRRPKGAPVWHPKPAAGGAQPPAIQIDPALDPVQERHAQIEDAVVRILGAKTLDALTTADGKETLKRELLAAVAQIVPNPEPSAVYIVQLVAQ